MPLSPGVISHLGGGLEVATNEDGVTGFEAHGKERYSGMWEGEGLKNFSKKPE